MPATFQYERYADIVRRLEQTRAQRKRVIIIQGLLTYFALLLGVLVVCALLEAFFHFPDAVRRWMFAAFLLALFGGAAVFVFRPLFVEWTIEQVALFVESAYPQIRNALINAVRLAKADVVISPSLVNEAIKEAAIETGQYDFKRAIDRRPLIRSAWAAGAATAAAMTAAMVWPQRFGNALNRILMPTRDVPAVGDITIEKVDPGDATVISGDDMVITAEISNPTGRRVEGVLLYRPDEGEERTQIMSPRSEVVFGCDILGVKIPFRYRLRIGGSETKWFRVRVVDEPRVVGIDLKFTYPPYSGLPPQTLKNSDGNIKALTGAVVDMTVRANKKIRKAFVRIDDKTDIPLQVRADGVTMELSKRLVVTHDGVYVIRIEDTEGYSNRNPITYYIRAMPDEKPTIKFGAPGKDTTVPLGGKLEMGLKASDDYGLAIVEILAVKTNENSDEKPHEEVIKTWAQFPDPKNASLAFDWRFPKDRYKIGDKITYYAQATDNKPGDKPNVSRSAKFKVEIKDIKAEKAKKQKEYFEWRRYVEKALDQQIQARRQTDALLKALGVTPHGPKK